MVGFGSDGIHSRDGRGIRDVQCGGLFGASSASSKLEQRLVPALRFRCNQLHQKLEVCVLRGIRILDRCVSFNDAAAAKTCWYALKNELPSCAKRKRRLTAPLGSKVSTYQRSHPPRNSCGTNFDPAKSFSVNPNTKNWLGFVFGPFKSCRKSLSFATQNMCTFEPL